MVTAPIANLDMHPAAHACGALPCCTIPRLGSHFLHVPPAYKEGGSLCTVIPRAGYICTKWCHRCLRSVRLETYQRVLSTQARVHLLFPLSKYSRILPTAACGAFEVDQDIILFPGSRTLQTAPSYIFTVDCETKRTFELDI